MDFLKFASENARREFPQSSIDALSLKVADLIVRVDALGLSNTPHEPEARRKAWAEYVQAQAELAAARETLRIAANDKAYVEYLTSELDPRD